MEENQTRKDLGEQRETIGTYKCLKKRETNSL